MSEAVSPMRGFARVVTVAVALGFGVGGLARHAAAVTFEDETPFDQAAFTAAQDAGKPILVHITAHWCTVCAQQKVILDDLREEEKFKPFLVYNVDFDTQKDLVRTFHATAQSTMVVYKGKTIVGFFSGETRPKGVALLLSHAL